MSSANTQKIRVSYFKTTFKNSQEAIPASVLIGCCGERRVLIGCCRGRKEMGLLGRFWRSNTFNEIAFDHCLNEKALCETECG